MAGENIMLGMRAELNTSSHSLSGLGGGVHLLPQPV